MPERTKALILCRTWVLVSSIEVVQWLQKYQTFIPCGFLCHDQAVDPSTVCTIVKRSTGHPNMAFAP